MRLLTKSISEVFMKKEADTDKKPSILKKITDKVRVRNKTTTNQQQDKAARKDRSSHLSWGQGDLDHHS